MFIVGFRGRLSKILSKSALALLVLILSLLAATLNTSAQDAEPGSVFARALLPGEVDTEGTVLVLHEDHRATSRYVYFLDTDRGRLELRFGSGTPALQTGRRVRVRGFQNGPVLALASRASVQSIAAAAVLPNTFGAQKTLVILVNFQNDPIQPYTVQHAESVVASTSGFDQENSFQHTSLDADVAGWYTIAQSSAVCDPFATATLAEQAASAHGINVASYPRRVYAFPSNACGWWGLGTVGGYPSMAWVRDTFAIAVLGHEMGHNFGLFHSKSLSCNTIACVDSEYGDYWDIMGNASSGHFNAYQKERLGWLDHDDGVHVTPPIVSVASDGIYSIAPYESQDDDPKALKFLQYADPATGQKVYYYVEYRAGMGFDSGLPSGVLLHTGSETDASNIHLLDVEPAALAEDWLLSVGQTYSDAAGTAITLLSADTTGATLSVTLPQLPCVPANPSIALSPFQSQRVPPGAFQHYTVTITNNDAGSCNPAGYTLSAILPAGWFGSPAATLFLIAPGASVSTSLEINVPLTAVGGNNFWLMARNSSNSSFTGIGAGTIIVASCLRANPTVSLAPPSAWVVGATGSYTVTVTNNDSIDCPASSFDLTGYGPGSWTWNAATLPALAAGASASMTFDLTVLGGAADGSYNYTVKATNSVLPSYQGSAALVQVCCSGNITVQAVPGAKRYKRGASIAITVKARVGGAALPGINVAADILRRGVVVKTLTGATDANGNAVLKYKLGAKIAVGAYDVSASAAKSGYAGSTTATFSVVK